MSDPPLPPFAALRAFAAVGSAGGIRRGAQALGVSHAIVSRHLSTLEGMLGVLLLNRQTGQLTEVGCSYHTRIVAAIDELGSATRSVRREGVTALTIWCSAGFALYWLTNHLPAYAKTKGASVVDLRSTESEPDFERNEADADTRYLFDGVTLKNVRDIRSEELARPDVFPVASPALLASCGGQVATLSHLQALPRVEELSSAEWSLWFRAQGRLIGDLPSPAARYGQAHLTTAAVLAGQGVALSNRFLVAEYLTKGQLVRVEPTDEPLRPVALGAYVFRAARRSWSNSALGRLRTWLHSTIAREAASESDRSSL